jgi:hypothetical protein
MRLQTIYKPRRKPKSYAQNEQKRKRKKVQHCQVHYRLLYVFQGGKALPGFFLCIFSSLTCLKKMFSASGIFCGGRYQPGCTGIF